MALGLAALFVAAVLLLAPSLSQLRFEAGKRLPSSQVETPEGGAGPSFNLDLFWRLVSWTLFILLPFSIIAAFIWPENFKYALIRAVLLALLLIMFFFTIRALKNFLEQLLSALQNLGNQGIGPTESGGVEELPLGSVKAPRWSIFPFLLSGLALLALAGWWLRRLWRRGRAGGSLQELAVLAGTAAEELEAGGDLRNVVLRCYREMSRMLSEWQRVPFQKAMTAREFERLLQRAGVQDEHIARLSRLFELVRYGGRQSGPQEAAEAISCLEAVQVAYGREAA